MIVVVVLSLYTNELIGNEIFTENKKIMCLKIFFSPSFPVDWLWNEIWIRLNLFRLSS